MDSLSETTMSVSFSLRVLSLPTTARIGGPQHKPRISRTFPSSIVCFISSSLSPMGEECKGGSTVGAASGQSFSSPFVNPAGIGTVARHYPDGPCLSNGANAAHGRFIYPVPLKKQAQNAPREITYTPYATAPRMQRPSWSVPLAPVLPLCDFFYIAGKLACFLFHLQQLITCFADPRCDLTL